MRAVFAHDHFLYAGSDGQVYSQVGFDYTLWQRYLAVFDELVVAVRYVEDAAARPEKAQLTSSGPGVTFAAIPNLSQPATRLRNRKRAWQRMEEAVRGADAVIARLPSEIGLLAVRVAQTHGVPWAVEVVGDAWGAYWNYGSLVGKLYAPVTYWRHRYWIRRSSHAIYVTASHLQRRYPSYGITDHASNVMIGKLSEDTLAQRIAQIRGAEERELRIGLIGLLTAYKGIDTAIEALAALRDALPRCELHFVGEGDQAQWRKLAHERGVGDRVIFHGVKARAELMAWLTTLDVYIQPSRTEGLPRALIEAMSTACPAIGSTAGGVPELLDAEAMHKPGDYRGLAQLLHRALTDEAWRVRQAEQMFERASAFESGRIEERRTSFWRKFREHAEKQVRNS